MDPRHTPTEDEYFYKLNRELIEKNRAKRDAERLELAELEMKKQHWMKCPKCGHDMEEIELSGLKIDKCTNCSGLYFDQGELETLLDPKSRKASLVHPFHVPQIKR